MNTVTVSTKYQVVIPKDIRDDVGLKPGAKLEIIKYGNRIELIPIGPMKSLKGFLRGIDTDIVREDDRL
jgi:AbrB family looped-hinge helix DNA binding protein